MEDKDFLSTFKRVTDKMISTNDNANGILGGRYSYGHSRDYTAEEIDKILTSGSVQEKIKLSRSFYEKDGFYKRILTHYATVSEYIGILIPNINHTKKTKTQLKSIGKKYYDALNFVEHLSLPALFSELAIKVLRDGCYYGIIQSSDRENAYIIDLPPEYCRTRYKSFSGNDIIEFDLNYFSRFLDEEEKERTLSIFPKEVQREYRRYLSGKRDSQWVIIPSTLSVCFPFYDGTPFFVSVIPSLVAYDEAVDREEERELDEIRKIIVQKIPHNASTDALLFEPEEAEEMHRGAVGMLRGNRNVSVLTTYADVDAIVSKTSSDAVSNNLEKMVTNIYNSSGVSSQLFASNGSSTLESSIKNDLALMRPLINKFANFVTNLVNDNFGKNKLDFRYTILPISAYNSSKYIEDTLKLANAGYSFMLPSLASGISQKSLLDLKVLENDVLEMGEQLIPLQTSYTQSAASQTEEKKKVGGQELPDDEKSDKTIENEESLDRQGGGNSTNGQ